MSNCIIYARVLSSEVSDKAQSLQGQIESCKALAKKYKMTIKNIYSEIISEETFISQREGLMNALQEAERTGSHLLVTSFESILSSTREREDVDVYKRLLESRCDFISVKLIEEREELHLPFRLGSFGIAK